MLRSTVLATAVALVIGGGGVVAQPASAAPLAAPAASVTFAGRVTSPTGKPVAGVKVIVRVPNASSGESTATTRRTSSTGRYELTVPLAGRVPGTYRFEVRDTGDEDGLARSGEWAATARTITTDAREVRADQVVHHGAVLTGRVLTGTGKPPKAGLRVYAVREGGHRATDTTWTLTRADGTYRFGTLPAARVEVGFYPLSSRGGVRFYTKGSPAGSLTAGTPLALAYGRTTGHVDVSFPPVGKITGRVRIDGVAPVGEGTDPVDVVLLDATGAEVRRLGAKPLFQLRDVDPGTYYLQFPGGGGVQPEYSGDSATLQGATPITVRRNGSVTGLVAELASQR